MYIKEESLDDILYSVYSKLLKKQGKVVATKGSFKEITGALLHLKRPRARLSRAEGKGKLFSCLGELAWYLSGSNELKFITSYIPLYVESSDDGKTVYGGYGPRIAGPGNKNQLKSIIKILSDKSSSRQAVIQLFDAKDILKPHKDIPCTCTLQFLIRNKKLHMFTSMRSNDVYLGLPHDVFAFTMIQEILARSLGCQLGEYKHYVSSLHLYEKNFESAEAYINSGYQQLIEMPEMPSGDPWPSIETLLTLEEKIRASESINLSNTEIDPYWLDLIRILQFFHLTKSQENTHLVEPILLAMSSSVYSAYLEKRRLDKLGTTQSTPTQLEILLSPSAK